MKSFLCDLRQCVLGISTNPARVHLDLLYVYSILRNISLLDVSVVTDRVSLHILCIRIFLVDIYGLTGSMWKFF